MHHKTEGIVIADKTRLCGETGLLLTDADGGEESGGDERRQAVLEGRLQDVIGEGERDDGQRGGIHDEDGAPQQQEPAGQRHRKENPAVTRSTPVHAQVTAQLPRCR